MIKKTIIAVALTTILATTAGAAVVSTDTLQKPYQSTVTRTLKENIRLLYRKSRGQRNRFVALSIEQMPDL